MLTDFTLYTFIRSRIGFEAFFQLVGGLDSTSVSPPRVFGCARITSESAHERGNLTSFACLLLCTHGGYVNENTTVLFSVSRSFGKKYTSCAILVSIV